MSQILPDAIGRYLADLAGPLDPALDEVARAGRTQGLPIVHDETGRLLALLTTMIGARRILEIGTAIGYSTLWMARALPDDGLLISIERHADRAAAARANLARAGLAGRASVMVGDAARLLHKVSGPFDLVFQDGDKQQYEPSLDRLVALLRPGGVLVTDNALWDGEVVPEYVERPHKDPDDTRAIAAYNRRLASDPRLRTMILPVGDGVAVAVVQRGIRLQPD
jgi:predicted O-methyltransferase YrrM